MSRHVHRAFVSAVGEPGDEVVLEADDRRHLERVLRMGRGTHSRSSTRGGTAYTAELVGDGRARLLEELARRPTRPAPAVWLGTGGGRADLAVEKLTELGVREIGALACERTRGQFRLDRWQRIAAAAGRQAKRLDLPALDGPAPFAEVVARPGAIVLDHEAEDAVPFAAARTRCCWSAPRRA